MISIMSRILAYTWWVVILVAGVKACTPTKQPPLVQKAHNADVIIHGQVVETYEDGRFDYGAGSDAYTAKMYVYCMYKGPRGAVPLYVNVTEAGYIPGHCHSTDLIRGQSYIVLLHRSNGDTLKPLDSALEPSEENKNEIMKACNMNVQYPSAASVNNYKDEEKCPVPVLASECVPELDGDDDDAEGGDDITLDDHSHEDHHMNGDDHTHDHNNDGIHDDADHHIGHEHDDDEHPHDDHDHDNEDDPNHDHEDHGSEDDTEHDDDHDHTEDPDKHDEGDKDTANENEVDSGKEGKDGKVGAVRGGDENGAGHVTSCISLLLMVLMKIIL